MPISRIVLGALIAIALVAIRAAPVTGCPICGQPTVTLSERLAKADAALLVAWVSAKPARNGKIESTTYEIVEVARSREEAFEKGQRLTVDGYHTGKPGSLVFLLGNQTEAGKIKWDHPPLDVTETSYQYIVQAPSPEVPTVKRLEYFVRFLEYPDYTIANDAFAEFVNASAADIFAVADRLPREKIRGWLLDEKTPLGRQSGYGLMLGLCGRAAADAPLLEKRILDDSGQRRVGIEGLIVGFLLLTREKGLERIEQTRLAKPDAEEGEVYAAQIAIRYLWSYGEGRIARERLAAAMRLLLDNPTLAGAAITDLARWKDWSVQQRVMHLFGQPDFDDASTRKAIVGYMIASTKDVPRGAGGKLPAHAAQGAEFLRQLREKDPKLVDEAEKFFYLGIDIPRGRKAPAEDKSAKDAGGKERGQSKLQ